MGDDYINQYGGKKDYSGSGHPMLCFVPATMGILSIFIYVVYLCSAFNGRSAAMALIVFVPILSIIGMIFSFVTRYDRNEYNALWLFGTISCVLSFVLSVFLYFGSWVALAQS